MVRLHSGSQGLTLGGGSNIIYLMAEGLTKKQFKELRKLEKMQSRNLEQKNSSIKWIAISVVSALFVVLFVGIIVFAKNKNKPLTANGQTQFANNGHARMLTSTGDDATNSAQVAAEQAVTIVEYGDLQCPACKVYHPLVKDVLAAYPDKVKLIFKNFPLTSAHPNAMGAAIAAEAAGRQGKYFQFIDMAYDTQEQWALLPNPQSKFEEYVKKLGLDVEKFKKDQKDPAIQKLINDERDEGIKNGVSGTPSFFVNGNKIENPASIDGFKKIIDEAIAKSGMNAPTQSPTLAPDKLPLQ